MLLTTYAVWAGIDTTGHTGTWALYLLAQHPAVEARLAAELDAAELLVTAKRPRPRQLQWADLARLAYLQAVIKARTVLPVIDEQSQPILHLSQSCVCWHRAYACLGDAMQELAHGHGPGAPYTLDPENVLLSIAHREAAHVTIGPHPQDPESAWLSATCRIRSACARRWAWARGPLISRPVFTKS